MKTRTLAPVLALSASIGLLAAPAAHAQQQQPQKVDVKCELTYSLSGWSAFYKTAKGKGNIACSNGQRATVDIDVKGGGVTFGKSEIKNGKGTFSGVSDIREVFGSYGQGGAHAGAVASAGALVMTKGNVSLALAGTGKGVDLGIDFGKFEIKPVE